MPDRFRRCRQSTRSSRSFIEREPARGGDAAIAPPPPYRLRDLPGESLRVRRRRRGPAIPERSPIVARPSSDGNGHLFFQGGSRIHNVSIIHLRFADNCRNQPKIERGGDKQVGGNPLVTSHVSLVTFSSSRPQPFRNVRAAEVLPSDQPKPRMPASHRASATSRSS